MNLQAIQHRSAPWDAYSTARDSLTLRLRCARGEAEQCMACYWHRMTPAQHQQAELAWICRDNLFDYFEATIQFGAVAYYTKYCFIIKGRNGESLVYTATAIQSDMPTDGFFEHLFTNAGDVLKLPSWARGITYYQIFVDRFCRADASPTMRPLALWGSRPNREDYMGGNLAGILHKLDHLTTLGVECLYLTPIFTADFNHKYATTDYFSVDPDFGDLEMLRALVEACHKRSIRVLLDGVFNHCGVHFAPFQDVLEKQEASQYTDWFYINRYPVAVEAGNYECVGDYMWMPKLNTSNPAVRQFVLNVMRYWIEAAGIDGWRLDVADEVDYAVWEYAHAELKADYPEILLLGETWGDGSKLLDGHQLDSVMNYIFRDAMLGFFAHGTIDASELDARLSNLLVRYHSVTAPYLYNLLDSHDTARFLTECGGDIMLLRLSVAVQMLFVGCPAIYYGDEVGLEGQNDPDCRRGMVWEEATWNTSLFEWYSSLAEMRKSYDVLRNGRYDAVFCEGDIFAFVRHNYDEAIYMALNRSDAPASDIPVPLLSNGDLTDLVTGERHTSSQLHENFTGHNDDRLKFKSVLHVSLPAKDIKILRYIKN